MSQITQKVFEPLADLVKTIDETQQGAAYACESSTGSAGRLAYIETYGCQMNFSDTEIIASILTEFGYGFTREEQQADLVLLNTCSIRENAEAKIWNRLDQLKGVKRRKPGLMVGIMGCMAERLKHKLLEQAQLVDLVVGPDAYRSLPDLLAEVESGQKAVNVLLSREETYADLAPIRLNSNGVSAFISIMRGCNNMCSFCVVPFTRGRERSRPWASIVQEAEDLYAQGYREVTLLGQNVDSYSDPDCNFAQLLDRVAAVAPDLRVRFSTSHPKDMTDEVLLVMASRPNICKFIHLPVQSGSSRILELMNRGHSREWYQSRIESIRRILPGCALSTDIITGFCSETEADHQDTLSLLEWVGYDHAFMFFYSERPGTPAAKKLPDDVALEIKKERLSQVIELQNRLSRERNFLEIGHTHTVLIEGDSKRSNLEWCGRTDSNKMVVFPKTDACLGPGQLVEVLITEASSATLKGELSA